MNRNQTSEFLFVTKEYARNGEAAHNVHMCARTPRETPRGGVFAKIPGLDQRLFVEARRINEPPKFSPPNLLAGTVRRYDAEEACNAAVRCASSFFAGMT